jgi:hypothetical protein
MVPDDLPLGSPPGRCVTTLLDRPKSNNVFPHSQPNHVEYWVMLNHDLNVLRVAKQRVGMAYMNARDAPAAQTRVLDRMLAEALILCIGSTPAIQVRILASYTARFKHIFN